MSRSLEFLGENWLGILFLLFACLLAVDIVTGFGFLVTHHAPLLRGVALLAGIGLSIIAFVQGFRPPAVNDYEIHIADLPDDADGLSIIVLSDLHIGISPGEGWLADRVEQVNGMNPDLIVLVGDIIEGHGPHERDERIASILRRLSAPLGVWGVTGNHERYAGLNSSVRFLDDTGVRLLHNDWSQLHPGLVIAGIDDRGDRRDPDDLKKRSRRALDGYPKDAAAIFLSHRPNGAEFAAGMGADLMISGHTHGGQIWPFDYITALYNDFLEGRHEVDGMTIIVGRGAGTWGPRMRLWSRGEIPRIILRAKH
jgi:predicted MPP superfamily phosphohydrolase